MRLPEGRHVPAPECWRDWKGPEYGNQGGQTARWADENVAAWLEKLDPEVALVQFGSDDLREFQVAEYRQRLRSVVRKCLDHETVVILSTIPPRHGFRTKRRRRRSPKRPGRSREMRVPLVDYHTEILSAGPATGMGRRRRFGLTRGTTCPRSSPATVCTQRPAAVPNDYSVEALRCHGFDLRSYLVLMGYAEVIDAITTQRPADRPLRESLVKVWYPKAPPLGSPAGEVIKVANADALLAAARRVRPGGTILLADGVYPMTRTLVIATNGVTLPMNSPAWCALWGDCAEVASGSSVGRRRQPPLDPKYREPMPEDLVSQRCAWPQACRAMATASIHSPIAWAAD